jgi:hypothetical protein
VNLDCLINLGHIFFAKFSNVFRKAAFVERANLIGFDFRSLGQITDPFGNYNLKGIYALGYF